MKKLIVICFLVAFTINNIWAQDNGAKADFKLDSIQLKDVKPFDFAAYENTGSYNKISAAYTSLWEESTKQFLHYGHFFSVYYNSPRDTPQDKLKWDVGAELLEKSEVEEPLKMKNWTHKKVVSALYDGPLGDMSKVYGKVFKWIGKNGHKPAGPILEKALSRPTKNKDGVMMIKLEIWVPVQI